MVVLVVVVIIIVVVVVVVVAIVVVVVVVVVVASYFAISIKLHDRCLFLLAVILLVFLVNLEPLFVSPGSSLLAHSANKI